MKTENPSHSHDFDLDHRLVEALDLYADGAPPPGLNAMADRARRHEQRMRRGVLGIALIMVFAAGWVSDDWIFRASQSPTGEVLELVEADRDWDNQIEFASFEDVTLSGVAPAPLTELGLYLSRTETLRAESGILQRMRYRSREGRRVSIVLKREVQVYEDDIQFLRHQGQDIAHWSDDVFSVGVIGDLPRHELQQIAERVRTHLGEAAHGAEAPLRLIGEGLESPLSVRSPSISDSAVTVAEG